MTQFEKDLTAFHKREPQSFINVNGNDMPKAIWNLILSKRDIGLWSIGMKPHRGWKVSDVKWYFGIKGNKDKLVLEIQKLAERHLHNPDANV